MIIIATSIVLISVIGMSHEEHSGAIIPFLATMFGSVTGYYFSGRNRDKDLVKKDTEKAD